MSTLFRPVGPHSPGVYWIRRLVALLIVLAVLLILFWLWGAVTGSGGGASATGTSSGTSSQHTSVASSQPATSTASSSPTKSASHSPSPTPSPTKTSTAHPTTSATKSTSSTPTPSPKSCADKDIAVTVSTDSKSYPAGVDPRLAMSVRNAGSVACTRDVGQAALELKISTASGTKVWSSDDCAPGGPHDVITLQPNQVFRTAVVWSRTTSKQGCPSGQPAAPSGNYQLVGRNLTVTSAAAAFTLL